MARIFLILTFVLSGCSYGSPSQAIEITNFKSGLVCPYKPNSKHKSLGWICFETETVHITGQGKCVYNGEEKQCTWYGFEFDYKNASADEEISCVSKFSEKVSLGNPEGVGKKNTSTYNYSLKLEQGTGHFYNPQYSVIYSSIESEFVNRDETVCSVGGKELFRFQFQLVFPTIDK